MRKTIASIGFLFASVAFGASFDCTKANTPTEKAICAHPTVSALDEQLASAYREQLRTVNDPSTLKSRQRDWVSQVRNKCEDVACLEAAYKSRIEELDVSAIKGPVASSFEPPVVSNLEPPATIPPQATQPVTTQALPPPEAQLSVAQPPETSKREIEDAPHISPPPSASAAAVPPISRDQSSSSVPAEKKEATGLSSLQLKLIGLAWLINAIVTIYLHRSDKLVIYKDYTDAAVTGLVPLVAIITYFILRFFEVPPDIAEVIALAVFALLLVVVVISTARNNGGLSLFFLMSLITKVTIVGLYYAIMAFLLFSSGSARRKGERRDSYEARRRREEQARIAAMAATTAGFVALSAWVCKENEFTPIGEYLLAKA
jgi:uncharacterized protein